MFTVRSPAAVACALRARRQLGIGRAYVAGLLGVDDLDAALDLLADSAAPAAAPIDQGPARACGGVRARADAAAPSCPGGRAAPARPASQSGS